MTPAQYHRATEVFEAALQHAPAEREAYLRDACGEDAAVVRAVARMLRQHHAPAFDLDSAALADHVDLTAIAPEPDGAASTMLPRRIGPYEIVGVLGEGGSSVVYRAHQSFPDRFVALKVLRRGVLSGPALRRFHAEVQTLAKLSHPGIAQIYQAGTYADGDAERPYFAMELVEGQPLTEFATQHRLTVRQRLALMVDVCRAAQHAHLRGVIHRDLKPGNILVHTPADGLKPVCPNCVPKILDFGIARATDLDVTRATLTAETGQIIGTLPYMSPEQLSGDAAAIDLRSDVYALGVVLFELLTGALPHRAGGDIALTEAVRRLAHEEPLRLGAVDRSLRGELEVIVATAMERDRARRYQSAAALADDLQAYMEHRPIRAKPPGPVLRTRKWLRRHPTTAATIGVVAAACIAIASLLAIQQRRAQRLANNELSRLMDEAKNDVQAYADDLDVSTQREIALAEVLNQLHRYNPPERSVELERREQELLRAKNDREASLHRIIGSLGRVQRLGAPEDEIRRLLARLYLARLREAEATGDRFARATYLELVRQNDPDGELAGATRERCLLSIRSEPPGAEAHLFRLVEQSELLADGEPRLVPVPHRRATEVWEDGRSRAAHPGARDVVAPGQFVLRVVDGRGVLNDDDLILSVNGAPIRDNVFVVSAAEQHGLRPLDRLISVDGVAARGMYDAQPPLPGVNAVGSTRAKRAFVFERDAGTNEPATQVTITGADLDALGIAVGDAAHALGAIGGHTEVWRRGAIVPMTLPPGVVSRITAKPMAISAESLLGVTPMMNAPVERGRYVLLLVKDGFEPLRVPLNLGESGVISMMDLTTWTLLPRGTTPDRFVRACHWLNTDAQPYWIMEREVTIGEYLEFLNDPETRVRIDASPTPILYPRSGSFMECGRQADGERLFTTGAEMRVEDPVLAVNWYDAMEYVHWFTARARDRGEIPAEMEYDLPSHGEWLDAWGCGGENLYPWGMHFRAYWTSSNYARQQPAPEPVMRFPIDESNIGVFDLAGSVSEWLNAWWIEERDQREIAGGSWGHGGGSNYRDMFMLYGQNGQTASVTNGTVGFRLVLRRINPSAQSPPAGR